MKIESVTRTDFIPEGNSFTVGDLEEMNQREYQDKLGPRMDTQSPDPLKGVGLSSEDIDWD